MLGCHFVPTQAMPAKSGIIRPAVHISRGIPRVGDRCEAFGQDGRRSAAVGGAWSTTALILCCRYNEVQFMCLARYLLQHTHTNSPPFWLCGFCSFQLPNICRISHVTLRHVIFNDMTGKNRWELNKSLVCSLRIRPTVS
jgi:hypothetical protein